jgi:type IV pilus assembly protein PilE
MNNLANYFRLSRKRRAGMSLVELAVVIVIIGILMTLVVPAFNRVGEQTRLDAAAQYLRSIWAAERVYWLETRTFTTSLANLDSMGLIDPKLLGGSDGTFNYAVTAADATTFTVTATRAGSAVWSGQITITQEGQVVGSISGSGGRLLSASEL